MMTFHDHGSPSLLLIKPTVNLHGVLRVGSGIGEALDKAPVIIRLLPAIIGAIIVVQVFDIADQKAVMILGAITVLAPMILMSLRFVPRRRGGEDGSWSCFELIVTSMDSLESLRRFLEERSRSVGASFRLVESFDSGSRRLILSVRGPEGEGEVVATVVSAMLHGSARIRPLDACVEYPEVREESNGGGRRGLIFLGHDMSGPMPRQVFLNSNDIEGHVGVFGSTGTGKSTTLRVLASRAPRDMRVVVLDWTGEHARVLSKAGFRVVAPEEAGGLDVVSCGGERGVVLELLSRALDLTEPQVFMIENVLAQGASSLRQVYNMVAGIPEESKWDREVKRAVMRKLGTLLRSVGGAFAAGCGILGDDRVVMDLSGVLETYSRRAIANLVVAMLFLEARRGGRRTLVVVDEAHNLASIDGRDVLNIVLAEARKFRLHVAYATQSPALIGDLALLNTNTKIVHAVKSQRDKKVIIEAMGLDGEWVSRLDKLGRGEALLQSPSNPEPILVSIEP